MNSNLIVMSLSMALMLLMSVQTTVPQLPVSKLRVETHNVDQQPQQPALSCYDHRTAA